MLQGGIKSNPIRKEKFLGRSLRGGYKRNHQIAKNSKELIIKGKFGAEAQITE